MHWTLFQAYHCSHAHAILVHSTLRRAARLREGLAWSQSLAKDFNASLDTYSARLTDLQVAVSSVAQRSQVRPCQSRGALQR